MIEQVRQVVDTITHEADEAGWSIAQMHVSEEARSVYLTLRRYDGLRVKVRVSDHRSRTFTTGKAWKRRQGWLLRFSILAGRPGALHGFVCWLRSHSAFWPPSASANT